MATRDIRITPRGFDGELMLNARIIVTPDLVFSMMDQGASFDPAVWASITAITDGTTGQAVVTVPTSPTFNPPTKWRVRLPTKVTLVGTVPDGSAVDFDDLMDEAGDWELLEGGEYWDGKAPPGPPGPIGPIGPTGPVIGVVGPTGVQGPQGVAGGGSLPGGEADVKLQFGAVGNGSTDDTTAIRNGAAGCQNGVLLFPPGTYIMTSEFPATATNVTVRGIGGPGAVTIKIAHRGDAAFVYGDNGPYAGYTFEDITFDGNDRTAGSINLYSSFTLNRVRDLTFRRCTFRDLTGAPGGAFSDTVTFEDCVAYGTRTGVMQAGVQDPPAVGASAAYTPGLTFGQSSNQLTVQGGRWHFLKDAISGAADATHMAHDWTIHDIDFVSDWWDGPYIKQRFTATVYNSGTGQLTAAAGTHFDTWCTDYDVLSFRRQMATGTISSVYGNNVTFTGSVTGYAIGDVLETVSGIRGRIADIIDSTHANVERWETIDTYESSATLPAAVAFRISRYYAADCDTGRARTDTTAYLHDDPVNPITGERAVADAALDLTTLPCRILAKTNYAGVHLTFIKNLRITNNRFRGSWADQISVFDSDGVEVHGNDVKYTQDAGLTLTRCERPRVTGNDFENIGSSIFAYSPRGIYANNTIKGWGIVSWTQPGCIWIGADAVQVQDNLFTRNKTAGQGGQCSHAVSIDYGAGCIIGGNIDDGSRNETLNIDGNNPGTITNLRVRDVVSTTYTNGATAAVLAPRDFPAIPTALLPSAATYPGGVIYDSTRKVPVYSDGIAWRRLTDAANLTGTFAAFLPTDFTPSGSQYADETLRLTPIRYYRFTEPSGTSLADSGSQNQAATKQSGGTVAGATGTVTGDFSLTCSGSAYAATLPNAGLPVGNSDRTLMLLLKTSSISNSYLFDYGAHDGRAFNLYAASGTSIVLSNWSTTVSWTVSNIADGNWHSLAIIYTGSNKTATLVLDGAVISGQVFGSDLNTNLTGSSTGAIGGNYASSGSNAWNGSLDEVAMFDYALTTAQVQFIQGARTATSRLDSWRTGGVEKAYVTSTGEVVGDSLSSAYEHAISRYSDFGGAVDAVAALNSGGGGTLVFDRPTNVTASKTVPANVVLKRVGQGKLTISGGQTLTVNAQPECGRAQLFAGAGTVAFGPGVTDVEVEWFGAKGDGTNEPVSTLQAAVNAFPTGQLLGKRLWARGDYKIDGTLLIENRSGLTLCGIGWISSRIRTQATVTGPPLRIQNCEAITLDDLHVSVGGTSRGVIEFVRAPGGTYGNWGHRGNRLFVDTDGSGVADYNYSWYCSTPGTEKSNNDTSVFTDCTARNARIANIETEGANASFLSFRGGEYSYAPTLLHLKGGEVHIDGPIGQGNGAVVRSGGTYNDTSKQYAVTDTTGMRAGDYFAVHTTSSIDSGACYPIASIVDSTHLTLTGNPYNGGGNKTGLYFAWMAPLVRMEPSPYTGETGYMGTLRMSQWQCEASGQAIRVHDDGIGNPWIDISNSTFPNMIAPGVSGNYYRHIDWVNAATGGYLMLTNCIINRAPVYAFTELYLHDRATLICPRIDTARVTYNADLTVIAPLGAPTYNNLGSGTLHSL